MVRITDRLDMTSAVYHGRKALNQTNITFFKQSLRNHLLISSHSDWELRVGWWEGGRERG